jgi:hypothetical protein
VHVKVRKKKRDERGGGEGRRGKGRGEERRGVFEININCI